MSLSPGMRAGLVVAATGTAMALSVPALADPGNGNGLQPAGEFTCTGAFNGTVDPIAPPNGQSAIAFVNGTVYAILSITGTAPDGTVVFHKDYGQRSGFGPSSTCVGPGTQGVTLTVVVAPNSGTSG